ncbi:MAG: sigma factor-like helix-turn-helix DNA-binding protein [Candidatus Pacebacteria bacterium]|nr:sigma factor-like helix-turn-helix DNA-binding protein [Candidatus Paceibacterota bacterium]
MLNVEKYKNTIDGILKELPERSQDVLSRRIGFGGNKETLEKIGKNYNITRERVRQIENKAVEAIQRSKKYTNLKEPFLKVKNFIDLNGGLKKEDILEILLTPKPEERPYLYFLLKIGNPFFYQPDSPDLYSFWKTKDNAPDYAKIISDYLVKMMEKEKRLFNKEELIELSYKEAPGIIKIKIPKNYIASYIEVTKKIEENPFGEFGPAYWPEVTPKGIRDEAYLVLKKEGNPMHFGDLAKIIEENLQRPVNKNTLHNELIKNEKFVLVGRGIYALREWGYEDGTVRDIIEKILDARGSLEKNEILKEVQKRRLVKETTIILNLQYFNKDNKGRYVL